MTESESQLVKCPYCMGEIHVEAKKCKHCGEWLEDKSSPGNSALGRRDQTKAGGAGAKTMQHKALATNIPALPYYFGRTVAVINLLVSIIFLVRWTVTTESFDGLRMVIFILSHAFGIYFAWAIWRATIEPKTWPFAFSIVTYLIASISGIVGIFVMIMNYDKFQSYDFGFIGLFIVGSSVGLFLAFKSYNVMDEFLSGNDRKFDHPKSCSKCIHLYNNLYCKKFYVVKLEPHSESCDSFSGVPTRYPQIN